MMKKRRKNQNMFQGNSGAWITTYADLVTLLLCFFVLLFAFSTIDVQKFEAIMSAFKNSLGVLKGGKTIQPTSYIENALNQNEITKELEEIEDFKKLKEILEEYLVKNDKEQEIYVGLEARGLLLRFKDNVLYDSGRAEIKTEAKETLKFLSNLLRQKEFTDKYIRVEGHTDTDPIIRSAKYPTNWELSVMRASNVVRFFIEELGMRPNRFSASGYSKYYPVAPNDTDENKAQNRRVDIVILRSEFVKSQPYY